MTAVLSRVHSRAVHPDRSRRLVDKWGVAPVLGLALAFVLGLSVLLMSGQAHSSAFSAEGSEPSAAVTSSTPDPSLSTSTTADDTTVETSSVQVERDPESGEIHLIFGPLPPAR